MDMKAWKEKKAQKEAAWQKAMQEAMAQEVAWAEEAGEAQYGMFLSQETEWAARSRAAFAADCATA